MREVRKAGFDRDGDPAVEHSREENRVAVPPLQARKLKTKPCPDCHKPYLPARLGQPCCVSCGIRRARAASPEIRAENQKRIAAARLKEARKEKAEYRAKTVSLAKLKNRAQTQFNRYIRMRDEGKPCICCGKFPTNDEIVLRGHAFDAGHYRSRGAADHLRFNEDNTHAQRVQCNRDKSGNIVEYRKNLIVRIGLERVEALENDNRTIKWTREELIAIRKHYHDKCLALVAEREGRA